MLRKFQVREFDSRYSTLYDDRIFLITELTFFNKTNGDNHLTGQLAQC